MILQETRDLNLVRAILTDPAVYSHVVDDFAPAADDFRVNDHPLAHYVTAWRTPNRGLLGVFCLYPHNQVCWEGHVAMLPESDAGERWEAARLLIPWLRSNTECRYLMASIPATNPAAVVFAMRGVGLQRIGRFERSFMKGGELRDLIVLGSPVG